MKILIAVDGSENSRLALWEVARRKWDDASEIKIIHVVESAVPYSDVMGVGAEIGKETHQKAVEKGEEIIADAEKIIREGTTANFKLSSEIITAQPFHSAQQEIVDFAEHDGTDLIVLGSRGISRWKSLILGSVSLAVIQHAPCSVEIVRPKRLVFEENAQ